MRNNLMVNSMIRVINDYYILDNKQASLIERSDAQQDKNNVLTKLGLIMDFSLKDCKNVVNNILDYSHDATYQRYIEHVIFNHINLPKAHKNITTGNFMVEDMYKVIKDYYVINHSSKSNEQKYALSDKDKILKTLGLGDYNYKDCVQVVQEILDSGIQNITPKECMEDLIVDRDLDLPKLTKNNKDETLTGDLGLTYNLQEANAIISGVSNHTYFNKISDAFNYLDLVDGNYLGTDDEDAVYLKSNKNQLATLADVYKEYNHAIKFIKNKLSEVKLAFSSSVK